MGDVSLIWGADLAVSATGDIATSSGAVGTQQRVIRRLLTNPGDYIWQLGYGAGLAQFVGQPANELYIKAVIRSQIFKESAVARSPEPVIQVQVSPGGSTGTIYVQIQYTDALSGGTQTLSFSVGS
jgi:phage baseplate assembly protein W